MSDRRSSEALSPKNCTDLCVLGSLPGRVELDLIYKLVLQFTGIGWSIMSKNDHVLLQQTTAQNLFAGHLGHLTPAQQDAFTKFKENLAAAGLYSPATSTASASHDEPTLLLV